MKKLNSTIIPVEPDTHKELEAVLKAGDSAKVMIEGSDTVFLMSKTDKGEEYEFTQVSAESPGEEMRRALEKIKEQIK